MIEFYAKLQAMWATRERGATAVEYGLMVALIAVVIIAAVTALGDTVKDMFNDTTGELGGDSPAPAAT